MFEPLIEDIETQIGIADGFIKVAKTKEQHLEAYALEDMRLNLIRALHSVQDARQQAVDIHASNAKRNKKKSGTKVLTSTS
jgi:hypothetical protein